MLREYHSLVEGYQASASGEDRLAMGEGVEGEPTMIGATPTVTYASKWQSEG